MKGDLCGLVGPLLVEGLSKGIFGALKSCNKEAKEPALWVVMWCTHMPLGRHLGPDPGINKVCEFLKVGVKQTALMTPRCSPPWQ